MGRTGFRINTGSRNSSDSSGEAGCAGRTFGLVFGLIFFGLGAVFLVLILRESWKQWQTRSWTPVPCTIVESRVDVDTSKKNAYHPHVRYRFFGAGVERTDERVRLKDQGFDDYADAQAVVDRYPVGATATAYLDRNDAARAILEHTSPWFALFIFLPLIFMLIGGAVMYASFSKAKPKPAAEQGAISEKARLGRGVGIGFFALFFIIGLAVWVPIGVMPLLRATSARSWPAVECTIVSSRVREVRGDDSTSYKPDILYRYTYEGREYHSSRHSPYQSASGSRTLARDAVQTYRPGRQTTCYVNPANPREALLTREISPLPLLLSMIPLVFVLVGLGGMFFTWRHGRPRDTGIQSISRGAERIATSASVPTRRGPTVLKPTVKPWMKVVGAAAVTLFWNGIVSIFVVQAVSGWMRGKGDLCMTAFMIPFVAIGLFLIGATVHSFLATFNPVPELTIEKGTLGLGDRSDITWRFDGATTRISRLKIKLEAPEECTYRRGTDTVTDKFVFHRQQIADTTRPMEISTGKAVIVIPPTAMHSFKASNNKIIWELTLHGEISGWPDVKLSYVIDVRPFPTAAAANAAAQAHGFAVGDREDAHE